MSLHPSKLVVLLATVAGLAAGCGADSTETADTALPTTTAGVPDTIAPDTTGPDTTGPGTTPPPTTIAITQVIERFEYYGPCGNETVLVGDTMYYQVLPERLATIEPSRYPVDDSAMAAAGLVRVPAPGPGDAVGTLVVYADGMARFQSDSGDVYWLTTDEQIYNWVC